MRASAHAGGPETSLLDELPHVRAALQKVVTLAVLLMNSNIVKRRAGSPVVRRGCLALLKERDAARGFGDLATGVIPHELG